MLDFVYFVEFKDGIDRKSENWKKMRKNDKVKVDKGRVLIVRLYNVVYQ